MTSSIKRRRLVSAGLVLILGTLLLAVFVTLPAWREGVREGAAARETHTRRVLESLADALERYRSDHGAYPPAGDERTSLVVYLDGDPANGGPDTVYYAFEPADRIGGEYMDLWREPYRYRTTDDRIELWSTAGRGTPPERHIRLVRPATPSGG